MNLPLSTAFTECHRFGVVLSFSFISMHILISFFISFEIRLLYRLNVLFSLHMFVFFLPKNFIVSSGKTLLVSVGPLARQREMWGGAGLCLLQKSNTFI